MTGCPARSPDGCTGGVRSDGHGNAVTARCDVRGVILGIGGWGAMREMVRRVEEEGSN